MHTLDPSKEDLFTEIAKAADLCMKPWSHSVIDASDNSLPENEEDSFVELIVLVECRSKEGERYPEKDLDLEIFKSGVDLNITISWPSFEDRPILWQGRNPVWMDSSSGRRCDAPSEGSYIEAFARRLRNLFLTDDEA